MQVAGQVRETKIGRVKSKVSVQINRLAGLLPNLRRSKGPRRLVMSRHQDRAIFGHLSVQSLQLCRAVCGCLPRFQVGFMGHFSQLLVRIKN
jgi:hypothetical protein